jgi:hypothetical protein
MLKNLCAICRKVRQLPLTQYQRRGSTFIAFQLIGDTVKAFGSKRAYHDCRVYRAGRGKKILFTTGVKSRKHGRKTVILQDGEN